VFLLTIEPNVRVVDRFVVENKFWFKVRFSW